MRNSIKLYSLFLLAILASCSSQQPIAALSPAELGQSIQNQSYQFNAQYVLPANGRQRNLSGGGYFLLVTRSLIVSELPYFGRAYSAPIGSTDGGIKFRSKDFSYSISEGKDGSKEIQIKPKDGQDVQELFLTIFENGSASLRVNSTNRQSISYTGDIGAPVQAKSSGNQ